MKKCKVEEFEKLRNFKNEEKLKLKIFNFGWWRNRIRRLISETAYNCRRALRINFFINFFTLRGLVFID